MSPERAGAKRVRRSCGEGRGGNDVGQPHGGRLDGLQSGVAGLRVRTMPPWADHTRGYCAHGRIVAVSHLVTSPLPSTPRPAKAFVVGASLRRVLPLWWRLTGARWLSAWEAGTTSALTRSAQATV